VGLQNISHYFLILRGLANMVFFFFDPDRKKEKHKEEKKKN